MSTNFLLDKSFLLKLNQHRVREYVCAILVLDFETEAPIARIEGKVASGQMNVAANSPTRKTGSLKLVFDKDTFDITNVNNLIAINKKISLSIGFVNPFYHMEEYRKYGDTLWFKQGIFIITKASISVSAGGAGEVSVEFIDKMGLLNGTCGGTFPASVSFHESIIIDENEDQTIEHPLISEIIKECVHHYGGEHYSRIMVEDIPDVGRSVVSYNGSTPLRLATTVEGAGSGVSLIVSPDPVAGYDTVIYKGQNAGYMETPLTYPGELIMKAGGTVTQLLDEIVSTLGNYEYFYDAEGVFHFRQIKNYQATGSTPLNFTEKVKVEVTTSAGTEYQEVDADASLQSLYLPRFSNSGFMNEFSDASLVTSINFNPNYANIKNDFIVWGTKTANEDAHSMVRYHLAIDSRPKEIKVPTTKDEVALIGDNYSLCHKDIREVRDKNNTKLLIRYQIYPGTLDYLNEVWGDRVAPPLEECFPELDSSYHFNWREELYRRALLAYGSSTEGSYYDEELMAEWRNLYDPTSTNLNKGSDSFQKAWEDYYGEQDETMPWFGYTIDVKLSPEKIRYWLDIIDTTSALGQYSVSRIGRRSKVVENAKINKVFEAAIPDIVYFENKDGDEQLLKNIEYYLKIGQLYCPLTSDMMVNFNEEPSYGTCYEEVRALLYNHCIYNASISMNCIPIFYLDVNQIVKINLPEMGIVGDYVLNSFNWAIGNTQTMSLSLNEAITVV